MNSRLLDITGQVFGKLTVLRLAPKTDRRTRWICKCECGRQTVVVREYLITGHTRSCGCLHTIPKPPKINLIGKIFGRLTVVSYAGRREGRGDAYWKCKCVCGNEPAVSSYNLRIGASRSCGCQTAPALLKANITHGRTGTVEYRLWAGMLTRCYNENEQAYPHYGGRGIFVCDRWRGDNGFINFFADMGKRPSSKYTIERKNNDGPYSPDNCCWATRYEQARNKRTTIRVMVDGELRALADACKIKGLNYGMVRSRMIRLGWSADRAMSTPLLRRRRESGRVVEGKKRKG